MNKFTYSDCLNDECTFNEYKNSLNLVKPELNKKYIQNKGHWAEKHYKIIFVNDDIAIGICVFNKISMKFIGDYRMFNMSGFTYNDTRPDYRLMEEIKEEKL